MNAPARTTADGAMLVTLTVAELCELLREAVLEALAEQGAGAAPAPLLVGPAELARLLDCSRTTIHRLRTQGMPAVAIGDGFRFESAACLAWLRERTAAR